MKCAIELIEMKAEATRIWEKEEAIKDMAAAKKYLVTCANTIDFCETFINDTLVNCAKTRKPLEVFIKIKDDTDRLNNKLFYLITADGDKYADGTLSYSVNKRKVYSLEVLEEYLKQHCIKLERLYDQYKSYGIGVIDCYAFRIYIPNKTV